MSYSAPATDSRNTKTNKATSTNNLLYFIKRDIWLYGMILIPMIAVIIFNYAPMAGLVIAFKDYDVITGFADSPWIGFDAFQEVFKSRDFLRVLRNTLALNLMDLVVGFPAPIVLAIALNEVKVKWFKKLSQTLLYMPHFLSWIIIAGIMYQLLSPVTGLVNILIKSMGGQAIPFLSEKWHWLFTYNAVGVWQSAGWGTIIYLAAITGINGELYEAAVVDGAGRFRKIWHITLPGIRSTIVVMLIITLGRILNVGFDRPYAMGNPIVKEFSEVISTYVYDVGIKSLRYNISTAVGLFQSAIGLALVLITDYISKKLGEQGIV